MVVPLGMRKEMLHKIHEGHMGIVQFQQRAHEAVYWPGVGKDINDMVQRCQTCLIYSPAQQKEKMVPHDTPAYQWQKVGADLFQL